MPAGRVAMLVNRLRNSQSLGTAGASNLNVTRWCFFFSVHFWFTVIILCVDWSHFSFSPCGKGSLVQKFGKETRLVSDAHPGSGSCDHVNTWWLLQVLYGWSGVRRAAQKEGPEHRVPELPTHCHLRQWDLSWEYKKCSWTEFACSPVMGDGCTIEVQ